MNDISHSRAWRSGLDQKSGDQKSENIEWQIFPEKADVAA